MLFKRLTGVCLTSSVLLGGLLFSAEIVAADRGAPVSSATSPEMENRLANIERLLQNNGLLDMLQQIELLKKEVARLRGDIEVSTHALDKMQNRQRDLYTDIDRRLQAIENQTTGNAAGQSSSPAAISSTDAIPPLETLGPKEPVAAPENQITTSALTLEKIEEPVDALNQGPQASDAEQQIATNPDEDEPVAEATSTEADAVQIQAEYQQAFKLLKQSQYDQAIKAFGKFLQAHPNNQYSDNAQYWMAEALYVKRQYEDAIREYSNLVSNYPDSQKVPHGLLKIGYSYQELGKADEAKLWYTDLRQRFPGTTASRLADDRLKHINDS